MKECRTERIPQSTPWLNCCLGVFLCLGILVPAAVSAGLEEDRQAFRQAWDAASHGDRKTFERQASGLGHYLLYPYLRYEALRADRAQVAPAEMAAFLEEYEDWAFASGLRDAWLRTLGDRAQWKALVRYAPGASDEEIRCHLASARVALGDTAGLLGDVQKLWTRGESMPKACDPAFDWLRRQGGITPGLAWERIRLAMEAGNSRFTRYLERYVPPRERAWVDRWQSLARDRFRKLEQARAWPDEPIPRMVAGSSLLMLARTDSEAAWRVFQQLDGHFSWEDAERGRIAREVALRAAVDLGDAALPAMAVVPPQHRDGQLLEWWARTALARRDWPLLLDVVGQMPTSLADDGRWRYWKAVALAETGERNQAQEALLELSLQTSFYGFRAADVLDRPYTICPLDPPSDTVGAEQLRRLQPFARALELRAVGLDEWAESEWVRATRKLDRPGLQNAAVLAHEESWHDRAIFALGDSGDRRFYEWRFPILWQAAVEQEAGRTLLDTSLVLGVMRSESALAPHARSSAGAIGLMQVTPGTARRLSRKFGIDYGGSRQLEEPARNIRFGTTLMRELLDRFEQNPVLAAGAYNAGPGAVDRWLRSRPSDDIMIWMETVPYFETRDYIPRVLAFAALYDWRLGHPVQRVSSRMPQPGSVNMSAPAAANVVCSAAG